MFWKAQSELIGQEELLTCLFTKQTDSAYQTLIVKLEQPNSDLMALAQEYQQIQPRNYFHSNLGQQVRERLLAARGGEG